MEEADLEVGNRMLQQSISALYSLRGVPRSQVRQPGTRQADDVGKGDRHLVILKALRSLPDF